MPVYQQCGIGTVITVYMHTQHRGDGYTHDCRNTGIKAGIKAGMQQRINIVHSSDCGK